MRKIGVTLTATLILCQSCIAKTMGDASFDKAVEPSLRRPFRKIVNASLAAQTAKDWITLFDLQWPVALDHETKDHYVKSRNDDHSTLKEFRIIRIDAETMQKAITGSGSWTVLGCARIQDHSNIKTLEGALPVYLVEGRWYAGEVGITTHLDGDSESCRLADGVDPKTLWAKTLTQ
jgi:hypothetical protein